MDITEEEFESKQHRNNGFDKKQVKQFTDVLKFDERRDDDNDDGGVGESWLHQDLVVRVVSRSYQGGKFFKQKVGGEKGGYKLIVVYCCFIILFN